VTIICLSCLFIDCTLLRLTVGTSAISQKHTVKFDTKKAHTQAQAAGKLLHCTVFASYTTCQHGTSCYFNRTQPPQSKSN
jgi:hypothetical protein